MQTPSYRRPPLYTGQIHKTQCKIPVGELLSAIFTHPFTLTLAHLPPVVNLKLGPLFEVSTERRAPGGTYSHQRKFFGSVESIFTVILRASEFLMPIKSTPIRTGLFLRLCMWFWITALCLLLWMIVISSPPPPSLHSLFPEFLSFVFVIACPHPSAEEGKEEKRRPEGLYWRLQFRHPVLSNGHPHVLHFII